MKIRKFLRHVYVISINRYGSVLLQMYVECETASCIYIYMSQQVASSRDY